MTTNYNNNMNKNVCRFSRLNSAFNNKDFQSKRPSLLIMPPFGTIPSPVCTKKLYI